MRRLIARTVPTRKISKLKGTRSDYCYVVADGISTKWLNPEHLSNEDVIFVGSSPSIDGLTLNNRAIWVFPEPEVLLNRSMAFAVGVVFRRSVKPPTPFQSWTSFGYFRLAYLQVVKRLDVGQVVIHLTNYFTTKACSKWAIFRKLPQETGVAFINEPFRGSLNSALSIALLLGYKEVRLIGFDYLLDPPQSGHWYEEGEPIDSPEVHGIYEDFLVQLEGRLRLRHVVRAGQRSQIASLEHESILGSPRIEPNSMSEDVRLLLKKSGLYQMDQ